MKSLVAGEQIKETVTINCKFGRSTLYLSNKILMIENSRGMILELDYLAILSIQPIKKKLLKIVWREENHVYDFVFNYEKPEELATKYRELFKAYSSLLKKIGVQILQTDEEINIQNPVIESKHEKHVM